MHVAFRFCLVVLSGLAGAASSWAQQTGTLAGVVRDAQGAVLPGVTVTATSDALLGARTSPTGATGTYLLTGLPPGTCGDLRAHRVHPAQARERDHRWRRPRASIPSSGSALCRRPSPSAARRWSTSARPSRRPTLPRTSTKPFPRDGTHG